MSETGNEVTMAEIWESLEPIEREMLSRMIGVPVGQLALGRITTVLKAVMYRYHDQDIRASKNWQRDSEMMVQKQRALIEMEYRMQQTKAEVERVKDYLANKKHWG